MDVVRNESGDFIVSAKTVTDFGFWKGLSEHAMRVEREIEIAYARTWGEEGQIALSKVAKELFGVDVDFRAGGVAQLEEQRGSKNVQES